jgi:hypothetical protein
LVVVPGSDGYLFQVRFALHGFFVFVGVSETDAVELLGHAAVDVVLEEA